MSDRIVVMNEGRVPQIGTPDEIYGNPSNTFVVSFLGTLPMNLIRCVYGEERNTLRCSNFDYELLDSWREVLSSRTSDELVLGVRPEDIEIGAENPDAMARVLVVEPLRKDVVITLAQTRRLT